jgi:hypothetical protein
MPGDPRRSRDSRGGRFVPRRETNVIASPSRLEYATLTREGCFDQRWRCEVAIRDRGGGARRFGVPAHRNPRARDSGARIYRSTRLPSAWEYDYELTPITPEGSHITRRTAIPTTRRAAGRSISGASSPESKSRSIGTTFSN